jgi:hypothetical protein
MSFSQKLMHELKAIAVAFLFFGLWIAALILLKTLVLSEYQIGFSGWSKVIVGALILAKVVLILERSSFGAWVRKQPVWVDVLLRTALYSVGVAVVLVLEDGFAGRHEHGGFGPAVAASFQKADVHHVWANALCLSGALLTYNLLAMVRQHLGPGGLSRLLLDPLSETRPRPQP